MELSEFREFLLRYDETEIRFIKQYFEKPHPSLDKMQFDAALVKKRTIARNELLQGDRNVTVCRHRRYHDIPYHAHADVHLIYMFSGTGQNITENEAIDLEAGDFCMITPGAWHLPIAHGDSVMMNIIIRCEYFEKFVSGFKTNGVITAYFKTLFDGKPPKHLLIKRPSDPLIIDLTDRLLMSFYDDPWENSQLEQQAMFETIICRMVHCCNQQATVSKALFSSSSVTFQISQILLSEYRTITLEELSNRLNYSKAYICSIVKKIYGTTFSSLVNRLRIDDACKLLQDTNMTVSQIATKCGFNNIEYFNRTFKKINQCSPTDYRLYFR